MHALYHTERLSVRQGKESIPQYGNMCTEFCELSRTKPRHGEKTALATKSMPRMPMSSVRFSLRDKLILIYLL